jgi:hypothetical protein
VSYKCKEIGVYNIIFLNTHFKSFLMLKCRVKWGVTIFLKKRVFTEFTCNMESLIERVKMKCRCGLKFNIAELLLC